MDEIHKAVIRHYHKQLVDRFGTGDYKAVGWTHAAETGIRMQILAEVGDLNGKSVLDLGCGDAAFYPVLNKLYPGIRYKGIEFLQEFYTIAKAQFAGNDKVEILKGDFSTMDLPPADYAFASGSLSYHAPNGHSMLAYAMNVVRRMFESAREGVAFNMLDKDKYPPNMSLHPYDPEAVLAQCREITANLRLRQDGPEKEFTIYLYK